MKRNLIVVSGLVVVALAATFIFLRPAKSPETAAAGLPAEGAEYYTCPMHPSVIAYKPGACPICGMTLVKRVWGGPAPGGEGAPEGVTVSGAQRVQANISTAGARTVPFAPSLTAAGIVSFAEPLQSVVAARGRGRIEHLYVSKTGTVVRKGEPLLSLYSPEVTGAEQEYLVALSGDGDSSGAKLADASRERLRDRFGLTDAQISRLTRERTLLGAVTYCSPITGTVIRKPVVEGQYVDEGTTLFELADLTRLWVIASVPEEDLASVRVGGSAGITVEAYPGEAFRGRITFVEPVLDAESRSVRVRMEIANPAGKLKPNMYARVVLRPASREALVVPSTAVLYTGKHPLVWVETAPGRFEPRVVEPGASDGASTEILSGLSSGEMVAVTGGFLVDSESRLEAPARGGKR